MLIITLAGALMIGYLALKNGQSVYSDSINKQLITLREAQVNALKNWTNNIHSQVDAIAKDPTAIQAMNEFSSAYNRLGTETIDSKAIEKLQNYYQNTATTILGSTQDNLEISRYMPRTRSGQLLQYDYIASTGVGKSSGGLKRYYHGVHAYYHNAFQQISDKFGFDNMYLIDLSDGAIVYSVHKNLDYSTRLLQGPYEASPLGHLFSKIKRHQTPGSVLFSDFEFYFPNGNQATAFVGTTLFDENQLAIGALVFAIKIDKIDQILKQQNIISAGIGNTAETLVVGQDRLLRSNLRFIHSQSDSQKQLVGCYARTLQKQQKITDETADQICSTHRAHLIQTIHNGAVDSALKKERGIDEYENYLGEEVITAYAPFSFGDLNWAVNTQVLKEEAHEALHNFQRNLIISLVLIICATTFLAMLIAYLFVNPVSKLTAAAKKLSRGETDIAIHSTELDEYGELGRALQQTAHNIENQLQQTQTAELKSRQLIRNTLPERFVQHYLDGNRSYSEQIKDVTVLYLILNQQQTPGGKPEVFSTINLIMDRFHQIAGKNGAEYVRVIGSQLIACFGFRRSRLDYTKRSLHCAQQFQQEMSHLNQQNHTELALRIGIANAALNTGIMYVGKDDHFSYEVTGPAIDSALQLAVLTPINSISLSESCYRQIPESAVSATKQLLNIDGLQLTVWQYRHEQPKPAVD